ncbi:MAG: hypothetical protein PHX49_09075 [Bacteroidales bacterium]|jgi:hypothetical protein|nr:hypothetical protein [Bacteroidales bacterium]
MRRKIYLSKRKKIAAIGTIVILCTGLFFYVTRCSGFGTRFEICDDLGGNIFPSVILSLATTDELVIQPSDSVYVGNPKSCISIKVKSLRPNSKVRIKVAGTPFFEESISEFVLEKAWRVYQVYPDIVWKYDALKGNNQPIPVSMSIQVELNGDDIGQRVRTFSVRSINECLLGYRDANRKFKDTGIFFAAYVNEEHQMIDQLLREALDSRIVNRFMGYQSSDTTYVDKQVYALWYVLQSRKFKYSSVSNSSLSSNVVYSQRVRTLDNSIEFSQINCVDGSVLFASLLKAINIDPVLVKTPTHMFVGYYLDKEHKRIDFLETSIVGDVNLEDYFPEQKLDSSIVGKSRRQVSQYTFVKSKEYANALYKKNIEQLKSHEPFYMFLEISKDIRRRIQPIGR